MYSYQTSCLHKHCRPSRSYLCISDTAHFEWHPLKAHRCPFPQYHAGHQIGSWNEVANCTIRCSISRTLIRQPKDLVLQPSRLMPGDERLTNFVPGSLVGHIGKVRHKYLIIIPVQVTTTRKNIAESVGIETEIDAYIAEVCVISSVFATIQWWKRRVTHRERGQRCRRQ